MCGLAEAGFGEATNGNGKKAAGKGRHTPGCIMCRTLMLNITVATSFIAADGGEPTCQVNKAGVPRGSAERKTTLFFLGSEAVGLFAFHLNGVFQAGDLGRDGSDPLGQTGSLGASLGRLFG